MRFAALLTAIVAVVVGIVGLLSPESLTAVRRLYFATPVRLYPAAAVRVAMGVVLILAARNSRAPLAVRVLGAVVCAQGLAAMIVGVDRSPAILEWETMHPALLRIGAAVAVGTGAFIAFAVTPVRVHRLMTPRDTAQ
jgi:hypothetical protein